MEQKLQNYANTRLVYKLDIFDQPQLIVDVGVGYRQCLKLIQNTPSIPVHNLQIRPGESTKTLEEKKDHSEVMDTSF